MYRIIEARSAGLNIKQFIIEAPVLHVSRGRDSLSFCASTNEGESIPLTIKAADQVSGTVTIVVQGVGKTTRLLNCLGAGEFVLDIVGPLGKPSEIEKFGTVLSLRAAWARRWRSRPQRHLRKPVIT